MGCIDLVSVLHEYSLQVFGWINQADSSHSTRDNVNGLPVPFGLLTHLHSSYKYTICLKNSNSSKTYHFPAYRRNMHTVYMYYSLSPQARIPLLSKKHLIIALQCTNLKLEIMDQHVNFNKLWDSYVRNMLEEIIINNTPGVNFCQSICLCMYSLLPSRVPIYLEPAIQS